MKGYIVTLRSDGGFTLQELYRAATVDMLNAAVGGFLEVVPSFASYRMPGGSVVDCVAFCDEDGKLKRLPFNTQATLAWAQSRNIPVSDLGDHLVGDIAVVFGDAEFMEAL